MEIELGQLLRAVRRWWVVPVVVGLLLGLIGFGAGRAMSTTSYTATTQMLVTSQITGNEVLSEDSQTSTYLALVTSGPVLDRAILELGLDLTREDLIEDVIEAESVSGTQIIEISVTTDDPELSADIANSLARNFVVVATDLSVGEMQRNLDDLRGQSETLRGRIADIDTRLAEIDVEENADDTEIQAEIAELERERLEISQTLADLDRSIRSFTTNLNTMSIPVVVTDLAEAPEEGQSSVSPVLLALLGVFLGGLIGAAWITWSAFSDRKVRVPSQIVSLPLLGHIKKKDVVSGDSGAVAHLAAKMEGIREASGLSIVLTSPRNSTIAAEVQSAIEQSDFGVVRDLTSADSVLAEAGAMKTVSAADHVVVIAEAGKSSIDDLEELEYILAAMNTSILGTILVE